MVGGWPTGWFFLLILSYNWKSHPTVRAVFLEGYGQPCIDSRLPQTPCNDCQGNPDRWRTYSKSPWVLQKHIMFI
jgi:hypothetical protein